MDKAFIFDMDGLLIDSEPLWREAEIAVFATVGIALTPDLCRQTMGMRLDAVVDLWYSRFPWEGPSKGAIKAAVLAEVGRLIMERGTAMPGAGQALDLLRKMGAPMALASSSPMQLIEIVVRKLGLAAYFDVVHSAEFEQYGKPHPAVYLTTAARLGVLPQHCIALEDSVHGVIAAKAAGMQCIAVPEAGLVRDKRFGIADVVLGSLEELDEGVLKGLGVKKR